MSCYKGTRSIEKTSRPINACGGHSQRRFGEREAASGGTPYTNVNYRFCEIFLCVAGGLGLSLACSISSN
jgi:hypothetical protein